VGLGFYTGLVGRIRHTKLASSTESATDPSKPTIAGGLLSRDRERGVAGGSVDLSLSSDPLGSSLPRVTPPFDLPPFVIYSGPAEHNLGVLIVLPRGTFSSKVFIAVAFVHLHQRQMGT